MILIKNGTVVYMSGKRSLEDEERGICNTETGVYGGFVCDGKC